MLEDLLNLAERLRVIFEQVGEHVEREAPVELAIEKVLQSDDVTSMSASSGISTSQWGDRVLAALTS